MKKKRMRRKKKKKKRKKKKRRRRKKKKKRRRRRKKKRRRRKKKRRRRRRKKKKKKKIQQQFKNKVTDIVPRGCQPTTLINPALFQPPSFCPDVVNKEHRPKGSNYLTPAVSYGYDILSATPPYEHKPRVSANTALRKIFEMKPGEMSERINKKRSFSMPYSSIDITGVIKKHNHLRDKYRSSGE